jgi:hypothetical protein
MNVSDFLSRQRLSNQKTKSEQVVLWPCARGVVSSLPTGPDAAANAEDQMSLTSKLKRKNMKTKLIGLSDILALL